MTAAGAGHVAISYLGSRSGAVDAGFSGYITESFSVLTRRPVFWSAAVNKPSRPLYPGAHKETFGDRLFFIEDAFAPDGTPWAAFHCVDEPACPSARIGVASRLAMPIGRPLSLDVVARKPSEGPSIPVRQSESGRPGRREIVAPDENRASGWTATLRRSAAVLGPDSGSDY